MWCSGLRIQQQPLGSLQSCGLKDLVLPQLWSRLQMWLRFHPWPGKLPYAKGAAIKFKKKKKIVNPESNGDQRQPCWSCRIAPSLVLSSCPGWGSRSPPPPARPHGHHLSLPPLIVPPQSLQNPSLRRGAVRNRAQRNPLPSDHRGIPREPIR